MAVSLESLLLCFSSLWLSDHVCREGTTLLGFPAELYFSLLLPQCCGVTAGNMGKKTLSGGVGRDTGAWFPMSGDLYVQERII